MKNKYHDFLTKRPNEGVKDEAPSWMNSFFEKLNVKTASSEKANFNLEDFIMDKQYGKCELCGRELEKDDVDVCKNCISK